MHLRGSYFPTTRCGRPLDARRGDLLRAGARCARPSATQGGSSPGLVDAHCHVGIRYGGGHEDHDGAIAQAEAERDAGALLLRDAGSPIDTRFIDDHPRAAGIIRAGRHIARPKRYIRELGIDLDDDAICPISSPSRPGSVTAGSRSSATGSTARSATWLRCGATRS